MELKTTKENICMHEILFNETVEESFELDYLLPDYYSSIFKILKTKVTPKILSKRMSSDKLIVDGVSEIKILYVAEDTNHIKSIKHKLSFNRIIDLKSECVNPIIFVSAKCDYVNCRVINPKRVDFRGAVNLKIKVVNQNDKEVISDACNMGIQLRKKMLTTGCKRKEEEKLFTIKEDIEVGNADKPVCSILSTNAEAIVTDYKIIPNKIIIKGEVQLHIVYISNEETGELLFEDKIIKISQILDFTGIDDENKCLVKLDCNNIELENKDDTNNKYLCELGITLLCVALKSKDIQIVKDVYSTKYDCKAELSVVKNERLNSLINQNKKMEYNLDVDMDKEHICHIYDTIIEFMANKIENKNDKISMEGKLQICVIGTDQNNMPIIFEKLVDCTIDTDDDYPVNNINIDINICVLNIKSNLSANKLNINFELILNGCIYDIIEENMVTNINIDSENPKTISSNSALTIYYADKNEYVWQIAKKYNSSIEDIIFENNLEKDLIEDRKMLLIPNID